MSSNLASLQLFSPKMERVLYKRAVGLFSSQQKRQSDILNMAHEAARFAMERKCGTLSDTDQHAGPPGKILRLFAN
jgi:hypothetical protein